MTDIKPGDRIRRIDIQDDRFEYIVTAVGERALLCKGIDSEVEDRLFICRVEKVEPFFEVGKKYRFLGGDRLYECLTVTAHFDARRAELKRVNSSRPSFHGGNEAFGCMEEVTAGQEGELETSVRGLTFRVQTLEETLRQERARAFQAEMRIASAVDSVREEAAEELRRKLRDLQIRR